MVIHSHAHTCSSKRSSRCDSDAFRSAGRTLCWHYSHPLPHTHLLFEEITNFCWHYSNVMVIHSHAHTCSSKRSSRCDSDALRSLGRTL
ncbi:hypothetical protein DUNSADRAFT_17625 [Dunaliella salina]|uniref:Encoded protein n=1 Tax=Dunaliella salina TaxID=3046 RepID=A0ABQ7GZX1_DUNSA|nr:hypothetical protein DUNSADRAFT_17625 [Dunaliella salina]|eukprot:KAF5840141.1 hypothetical protein DUNSADRAFT_17625 [Dunaliella salina]